MLDNHYVPEGYGIITNFTFGNLKISTYSFFVCISLVVGIIWFYVTVPRKHNLSFLKTYYLVAFVLIFGFIGSKILVIIENIKVLIGDLSNFKYLIFTGKSIVGGLIGGYLGIILAKKVFHMEKVKTGNDIAPAIALSMAIGRIGCFLTGCCYGIATKLPIGVNFGDGIKRIPTQLIELVFCLILFAYLFYKQKKKKDLIPGILFKELVLYYLSFRFLIEFIRATEKNILFLSIYQIICIFGVIFIIIKIRKEHELWKKKLSIVENAEQN